MGLHGVGERIATARRDEPNIANFWFAPAVLFAPRQTALEKGTISLRNFHLEIRLVVRPCMAELSFNPSGGKIITGGFSKIITRGV